LSEDQLAIMVPGAYSTVHNTFIYCQVTGVRRKNVLSGTSLIQYNHDKEFT
jgi:hypothetical protein